MEDYIIDAVDSGAPAVEAETTPETVPETPVGEPTAETPAPEAGAETATPDEERHKRSGIQRLKAQRDAERQAREQAQKEAAELRAKLQAIEDAKEAPKPPRDEDFTDFGEFLKANAEYAQKTAAFEAQKATRQAIDAVENRRFEAEQRAAQEASEAALQKFVDEHPDVLELRQQMIESDIPKPAALDDFCNDSDMGLEVVYALWKDPKEIERIAALPYRKQVVELDKLEERIKAEKTKPKPTTQAPKPPTPVSASVAAPARKDGDYLVY